MTSGTLREPSLLYARILFDDTLQLNFSTFVGSPVQAEGFAEAISSAEYQVAQRIWTIAVSHLITQLDSLEIPIQDQYLGGQSQNHIERSVRPQLHLTQGLRDRSDNNSIDELVAEYLHECPILQQERYRGYKCLHDEARHARLKTIGLFETGCGNEGRSVQVNASVFQCLQGKKIMHVGDSHERQHFIAFACSLYFMADGLGLPKHLSNDTYSIYFPSHDIHLSFYPANKVLMHSQTFHFLTLTEPLRLDRKIAQKLISTSPDVLVVGIGMHFHRINLPNGTSFDPAGLPWSDTNMDDELLTLIYPKIQALFEEALWKGRGRPTHIVWRTPANRHFVNGDWNSKGYCAPTPINDRQRQIGRCQRNFIHAMVSSSKMPTSVLDVTELTENLGDFHVGNYHGVDCSHWCILGAPLMWAGLLQKLLCVGESYIYRPVDEYVDTRLCPLRSHDRVLQHIFQENAAQLVLSNQLEEMFGRSSSQATASNDTIAWIVTIPNPVSWLLHYWNNTSTAVLNDNSLRDWKWLCNNEWPCNLRTFKRTVHNNFVVLDDLDDRANCLVMQRYLEPFDIDRCLEDTKLPSQKGMTYITDNLPKLSEFGSRYRDADTEMIRLMETFSHLWELYAVAKGVYYKDI